jgi:S1-C subfamily serine protease
MWWTLLFTVSVVASASCADAQSLDNKKPIVFIWSESVDTGQRTPLGSGFVLGESGDVLTARHVVEQFVQGEKLVVSISTKSTFPVDVDMSDVDCDSTQDYCFIRIPPDVIADRVSTFYRLGCYVPKADSPLMAAGFFAGGDMHGGVVTPRGNSIGGLIAGGLLPTSIPLEPGMSGGPVFDQSMTVIGIVKGGSTQFGHVQPLRRARSDLADRGFECLGAAQAVDRSAIELELRDLEVVVADIKRSLGLKSQLIQALDRYIDAPSAERWSSVKVFARNDLDEIEGAIDRAMKFSAKYGVGGSDATMAELQSILACMNETDSCISPTSGAEVGALESISRTWAARLGTLEQLEAAEANLDLAIGYRNDMLTYQHQLESDLDDLLGSFRVWLASL